MGVILPKLSSRPYAVAANAISVLALNQLTPQWLLMSVSFPVLSVCLCEAAAEYFLLFGFDLCGTVPGEQETTQE